MIIDVRPSSELLKKYIESFNVFEKQKNWKLNYYAFPQYGSTIELFENAKIIRQSNKIKITPVKSAVNPEYSIEVLGKYTEPVFFSYERYVNGFTINFKPLGINYFFNKSYKEIAPKYFQKLPDTDWHRFAKELFSIKDFAKKVQFAEGFLEKIYTPVRLTDIENAIDVILQNPSISIDDLATKSCMSDRNLLRKFIEYVGCSPTLYKRIVRFRKSIDFNTWKKQDLNCTDICYKNNFFDTSHFRKEFLKFTHQNPKEFFKTVSAVGNRKFPYKLI